MFYTIVYAGDKKGTAYSWQAAATKALDIKNNLIFPDDYTLIHIHHFTIWQLLYNFLVLPLYLWACRKFQKSYYIKYIGGRRLIPKYDIYVYSEKQKKFLLLEK